MSEGVMSDARFGKIFAAMIAGMVALMVVLIVLANMIGGSDQLTEAQQTSKAREVGQRIAPVGEVTVGQAPQAAAEPAAGAPAGEVAVAEAPSGQSVYEASCVACHGQGVAGAPKFGDADAWSARIAQGNETLYQHAINGFQGQAGMMPAKGGNAALSDDAVKAAVDYMLEQVQ